MVCCVAVFAVVVDMDMDVEDGDCDCDCDCKMEERVLKPSEAQDIYPSLLQSCRPRGTKTENLVAWIRAQHRAKNPLPQ